MEATVIIPTQHKRDDMLEEAINSVAGQTRYATLFVIDGGTNVWSALNDAVLTIKTDAFVVLSDDDMLDPSYIEMTLGRMEDTGCDLVSTPLMNFGAETGVHGCDKHPFMTSLIRTKMFKKVGGYDEDAGLAADADFYLTCLERGARWEKLGEPLFLYRKHAGQWSNHDNWEKSRIYVNSKHDLPI